VVYLDYAATTPIRQEVLDAYQKAAKRFYGNPSSLHDIGTKANDLLNACRIQLSKIINGNPDGIYFTSGGTESNILAIKSLIDGNKEKGNHLITTEVEHSSLYNLFKQLEQEGFDVTYLPVDVSGELHVDQIKNAVRDNTILASIHHGNAEIGVVQNIAEIGKLLHERDVIFHTDCVQTFGNIPIDVQTSYIDSLSVSSHKIYGPKGTGMCYMNPNANWKEQIAGTVHEKGFRPGTVDVPSIAAFATAAELMIAEMEAQQSKYRSLRNYLNAKLSELGGMIKIEGSVNEQLPHIVGLTSAHLQGQYIMLECNRYGIAISTGSACQVGNQAPSRTMKSMGKSEEEAQQFIRLSFGKETEETDIDQFVKAMYELFDLT